MSAPLNPESSEITRVVYVTVVNIGTTENGGSIVCRQHIDRLRNVPSVELTVCLIGTHETNREGARYLADLGIPCVSFVYGNGLRRPLYPFGAWPFSFENLALRSLFINEEFLAFAAGRKTDIFVLDYLFTALFIPALFEIPHRVVVLTLNPETDFYDNLRKLGRLTEDCSKSAWAVRRLARFENWVYRHSSQVVTLSPNDIPQDKRVNTTVIRPVLEPKFLGWQHSGRKDICFVGGIAHFPNWLAVRWLCNEFAPALAARDSKVRIQIVGAEADGVPVEWRRPNVDFLGTGSREVHERMLTCGLFIAPIENNYGSKIKILECLAYGTPLLATPEALAGLEDHDGLPLISLNDPAGAADAACRILSDLEALLELSALEGRTLKKLLAKNNESWRELIARVKAQPLRKAVPRLLNFPAFLWGSLSTYRGRKKGERVNLAASNAPEFALEGFQDPAMLEGMPIRWTNGVGRIRVISRGRQPRKLRLECWSVPAGRPARVAVKVNGQLALTIQSFGTGKHQTVQLPRPSTGTYLTIEIEGETADQRPESSVPLRRMQMVW
jgi:glycosyltransferase involved in cell wall biosynthesis